MATPTSCTFFPLKLLPLLDSPTLWIECEHHRYLIGQAWLQAAGHRASSRPEILSLVRPSSLRSCEHVEFLASSVDEANKPSACQGAGLYSFGFAMPLDGFAPQPELGEEVIDDWDMRCDWGSQLLSIAGGTFHFSVEDVLGVDPTLSLKRIRCREAFRSPMEQFLPRFFGPHGAVTFNGSWANETEPALHEDECSLCCESATLNRRHAVQLRWQIYVGAQATLLTAEEYRRLHPSVLGLHFTADASTW